MKEMDFARENRFAKATPSRSSWKKTPNQQKGRQICGEMEEKELMSNEPKSI